MYISTQFLCSKPTAVFIHRHEQTHTHTHNLWLNLNKFSPNIKSQVYDGKRKKWNQDIPVATHNGKKKKTYNQSKCSECPTVQSISSRLNNSRATNVNRSAISLYTSGRIQRRKHPHSKKKMLPRVGHGGQPPPAGGHCVSGQAQITLFLARNKTKAGYLYSKHLFFFIFCLPCVAEGILCPQSRIEPASLEAGSLTHGTAREGWILLTFQNTWGTSVISTATTNNSSAKEAKDAFHALMAKTPTPEFYGARTPDKVKLKGIF